MCGPKDIFCPPATLPALEGQVRVTLCWIGSWGHCPGACLPRPRRACSPGPALLPSLSLFLQRGRQTEEECAHRGSPIPKKVTLFPFDSGARKGPFGSRQGCRTSQGTCRPLCLSGTQNLSPLIPFPAMLGLARWVGVSHTVSPLTANCSLWQRKGRPPGHILSNDRAAGGMV